MASCHHRSVLMTIALCALCAGVRAPGAAQEIVIRGATVIDGTGAAPISDATLVVQDGLITALGRPGEIEIPAGAHVVDAEGKWVTPGFIDTNVHLSLYGGNTGERYESLVRYEDRQADIVLEAAQLQLKYGVTTVRDSYGVLPPLIEVRDRIARGEAIGSRVLAAGNIVGWGGPFSITFSLIPPNDLTLFQERMNDWVSQGAGEELMDMTPTELRVAINAYLDKGPDFIKYGGTGHFSWPVLIGFSPEAQKVMVDETHARGRMIETHATNLEGLRLSVEAGIDLIQHPEIVSPREMPDDLARLIVGRGVICQMLVNTMTGAAWEAHVKRRQAEEERLADADEPRTGHQANPAPREPTSAEVRKARAALGQDLEIRRRNAQQLIEAGCTTTVGTDNYRAAAPELARGPKPEWQDHGIGTIIAIEGLVELGMTPMEALVAATRNGAQAAGMLDRLGTLEVGKIADLVILDADPLADIRNIRELHLVMKAGAVVDLEALPERPIFFRGPS